MSYCTKDELDTVVSNAIGRVLDKHGIDKYFKGYQLFSDLVKEVVEDLIFTDIAEIYEEEEEEEEESGTWHFDEELGETYIY